MNGPAREASAAPSPARWWRRSRPEKSSSFYWKLGFLESLFFWEIPLQFSCTGQDDGNDEVEESAREEDEVEA